MANFFDKLNTLLQAHINDLVRPLDGRDEQQRRAVLKRSDIRRGLTQDVAQMRESIDGALHYQAALQAKVDELYAKIARYDEEADALVKQGRHSDARTVVMRLQQAQSELVQAEAALREHQAVTDDLVSKVSTLESMLQQAEAAAQADIQAADAELAASPTLRQNIPLEIIEADDDESVVIARDLSKKMDETRQQLRAMTPPAPPTVPSSPPKPPKTSGDDLDKRISRLAKPDDE